MWICGYQMITESTKSFFSFLLWAPNSCSSWSKNNSTFPMILQLPLTKSKMRFCLLWTHYIHRAICHGRKGFHDTFNSQFTRTHKRLDTLDENKFNKQMKWISFSHWNSYRFLMMCVFLESLYSLHISGIVLITKWSSKKSYSYAKLSVGAAMAEHAMLPNKQALESASADLFLSSSANYRSRNKPL